MGGMEEAAGGSLTTRRKRLRSRERENEMEDMNKGQVQGRTSEQQVEAQEEKKATAYTTGDCEDEEEEETLVVLELCDFKNHPVFDDYSSATLEGIDTATPRLRIGEYALHGQLEETVGQTIKKIKFTIAPPEDL